MSLYDVVYQALMLRNPDAKCAATAALYQSWQMGELAVIAEGGGPQPVAVPGRPEHPQLVPPHEVEHRGLGTTRGRAALVHALAHIEFNAINLALDAVYRFRDMPVEFYGDWLRVAAEEAGHFALLRDHLRRMGYEYGDFTAHNGLWEMAQKTAHDPLVRMALVPRLLEARGLDVTPGIRAKLVSVGDQQAASILDIILHDEVGHVAIGNRWFGYLCERRSVSPIETFAALLEVYGASPPRPPLNRQARVQAGFSPEEVRWLEEGR